MLMMMMMTMTSTVAAIGIDFEADVNGYAQFRLHSIRCGATRLFMQQDTGRSAMYDTDMMYDFLTLMARLDLRSFTTLQCSYIQKRAVFRGEHRDNTVGAPWNLLSRSAWHWSTRSTANLVITMNHEV